MKTTLISFYRDFYGHNFFRYFRRPPDFKNDKFKTQQITKNPKDLYLQVHQNSGYHPCYIQTYDRGLLSNLKQNEPGKIIFDRAYFDFDVSNPQAHNLKKELIKLRSHGPKHDPQKKEKLEEKFRNLLIKEHIAEPAINEAKKFAVNFEQTFGRGPILFFSGSKGCHAYAFFEPIQQVNINRTLSWFAENVKHEYNYQTLDESVNKDAMSRLSRVPYSKHQLTGLTVVPFNINDNYDEIMEKSLNPTVEPFKKENYFSEFGKHLQIIDPILAHNEKTKKIEAKAKKSPLKSFKSFSGVVDHRDYFKELLGPPESKHPDKEYVMYRCPFPDHEDNKPSFKVHRTNYECYGCGKKGNLARKQDYLKFKKRMGWEK
jgi:hypothetical protein